MALITSVIGPGDSFVRLGDFPVWLGIAFTTILVLMTYGSLFNTIGLLLPEVRGIPVYNHRSLGVRNGVHDTNFSQFVSRIPVRLALGPATD